nr:hypothetical protein [Paraburkholderia sp. BL8N3]
MQLHSGKYDELVNTRSKALTDAYVVAVNATIVMSPHGPRVVSFGQDLIELLERGLLMRSKQVFSGEQDERLPTWVYAYRLTSAGKTVAEALMMEAGVNTFLAAAERHPYSRRQPPLDTDMTFAVKYRKVLL